MDMFSRPDSAFHQLRILDISARLPANAFSDFLIPHSGTLKTVLLNDCASDIWDFIFRAIAKLRYERLYFEKLYKLVDEGPDDDGVRWMGERLCIQPSMVVMWRTRSMWL